MRTFNDGDLGKVNTAHEGEQMDVAIDFIRIPMRVKHVGVGFRPVLSPIVGGDGADDSRMVTRAVILTEHGRFREAKKLIMLALKEGALDDKQKKRANHCLEYLNQEHKYDFEDWSGLVTLVGQTVARRGYRVEPFTLGWMEIEDCHNEDKAVAQAYEEAGITASWVRIGDLPESVRNEQSLGEERHMTVYVGQEIGSGSYVITSNTFVQVLRCDFDGDGRKDLVVEEFGNVGSGGYWYDFFKQLQDGSYTNVLDLQTVGLCAVPATNGNCCAFINIGKCSNPILSASLISYQDGEMLFTDLFCQSFYMLDASEEYIYRSAPFIGAGYGLGWSHLQGRGTWYRPLYWPWRAGVVQGLESARKQAEKEIHEKNAAKDDLTKLFKKWPHAADRVSVWEMPQFAKRFHEIDYYQDYNWNKSSAKSNAEFEKMVREAISLKIEPSIWYYNLACVLALQNKKNESFEALEQAIVAGYDRSDVASEDSDFNKVKDDVRFKRLLGIMSVNECAPTDAPRKNAVHKDGVLLLTEDDSYFVFNHYAFFSIVDDAEASRPIYIDLTGGEDAPNGYCRACYNCAAKPLGIDAGMAKHYFRTACSYTCIPTIAYGKYIPEMVTTSAYDSKKIATKNVLGIYSIEQYPERLNWCILLNGTANDSLRLAEIIAESIKCMPKASYRAMVSSKGYAATVVTLIHRAMKSGKDGAVINVDDIDVKKLNDLAASGRVWTILGEDGSIASCAGKLGCTADSLLEINHLHEGVKLKAGSVLEIPISQ